MIVGILTIDIAFNWCKSLKDKRSSIKPLLIRLHKEFNVGVSELKHQSSHKLAGIGCVAICNTRTHIEQDFNDIVIFLNKQFPNIDILSQSTEYLF